MSCAGSFVVRSASIAPLFLRNVSISLSLLSMAIMSGVLMGDGDSQCLLHLWFTSAPSSMRYATTSVSPPFTA